MGWIRVQNFGRQAREEGAVLVLVGIFMVALLAFVALALDGSRALVERRWARNAADHAAMNAAWAACHGQSAQAAADTSVERNGYSQDQLTLTHVDGFTFRARVESTFATGFAGIVGVDQLQVAGVATAGCDGAGGGSYAIFAGGETCFNNSDHQIDVSGSTQTVWGDVHSNNNVDMTGADNDFGTSNPAEDQFTYVSDFDPAGYGTSNGNTYDPGYPATSGVKGWPIGPPYDSFDFWKPIAQANGTYFAGDITALDMRDVSGNYVDGVYFSENGDIYLEASDVTMNVTLVAQSGFIKISGSNQYLLPFTAHPDLTANNYLAYAGVVKPGEKKCTEIAISIAGGASSWNGVFYAPEGLIEMNGSSNSTVENGSLIGWAVRLNGSDLTIKAPPASEPGIFRVRLLQ